MRLHVCVSDYRFTTLFFFSPTEIVDHCSISHLYDVFYCAAYNGVVGWWGCSFCGKCIFYMVIECICIKGLTLRNGSLLRKREHKSTLRERKRSAREVAVTYLQLSHVKVEEQLTAGAHSHAHTLFTFTVLHIQIKGTFCRTAYQTHIFLFYPRPSLACLQTLTTAHYPSACITPHLDLQDSIFEVKMGENIISIGLAPDSYGCAPRCFSKIRIISEQRSAPSYGSPTDLAAGMKEGLCSTLVPGLFGVKEKTKSYI